MSKVKVLGKKYGIEITKPWSNEMYNHNDKVGAIMKENILQALTEVYKKNDEAALREIGKSVLAYGFGQGYSMDEMYNEICSELDVVQNFWLNDEYPYLAKKGYVRVVEIGFVGYDKNI
jgi:hypothetical protein